MKVKKISKNYIEKKIIESSATISSNFALLKNQKKNITSSINLLLNGIKKDKKIFFCGNGGSASDSQHLASELVGYFLNRKRKPIPAISLTTNTSTITAIANDDSFNSIFSRQLEGLGNKGDILFAISTSGKSKNVLKAINVAKKKKLKIIFLTSLNYNNIDKKIDSIILVPANRVDRIQEMHIAVGHIICELIEKSI